MHSHEPRSAFRIAAQNRIVNLLVLAAQDTQVGRLIYCRLQQNTLVGNGSRAEAGQHFGKVAVPGRLGHPQMKLKVGFGGIAAVAQRCLKFVQYPPQFRQLTCRAAFRGQRGGLDSRLMRSSSMARMSRTVGMLLGSTRNSNPAGESKTKVPMPCLVSTNPADCSPEIASRTTLRLTPYSNIISDSGGSFSPGRNTRLRICSESASPNSFHESPRLPSHSLQL